MAYGNSPPPKTKKKSPPKGFHKMPDGTLMKDSVMPSTGDKPKTKPKQKALDLDLKKGTFTRMTKEKGYGNDIQKFAKDIMKHKDKGVLPNGKRITPLMIKRANFVVVSGKWKK